MLNSVGSIQPSKVSHGSDPFIYLYISDFEQQKYLDSEKIFRNNISKNLRISR